ncbi:MAG: biotin/lipoate A/B protein ligase family protein [Fibrobacterota bacterium]
MALDEALLLNAGEIPVIRVYGWTPPALSLGVHQDASANTDLSLRGKVPVVRRLTGGRAVYHSAEITYSVTAGYSAPGIGKNLRETYSNIASALVYAFSLSGIKTETDRHSAAGRINRKGPDLPCFVSSSFMEITHKGKKLCGSAQARKRSGILQHGSIKLHDDDKDAADFTSAPADIKKEYKSLLKGFSCSFKSAGGKGDGYKILSANLVKGFEKIFGEMRTINYLKLIGEDSLDILEQKYNSESWTFFPERFNQKKE